MSGGRVDDAKDGPGKSGSAGGRESVSKLSTMRVEDEKRKFDSRYEDGRWQASGANMALACQSPAPQTFFPGRLQILRRVPFAWQPQPQL